jgi:hypothetical protein
MTRQNIFVVLDMTFRKKDSWMEMLFVMEWKLKIVVFNIMMEEIVGKF